MVHAATASTAFELYGLECTVHDGSCSISVLCVSRSGVGCVKVGKFRFFHRVLTARGGACMIRVEWSLPVTPEHLRINRLRTCMYT